MKYILLAFVMTFSFNLFSAENAAPDRKPQRSPLMVHWDTSKIVGSSIISSSSMLTSQPAVLGFGAALLVTAVATAPLANYYLTRYNNNDDK